MAADIADADIYRDTVDRHSELTRPVAIEMDIRIVLASNKLLVVLVMYTLCTYIISSHN